MGNFIRENTGSFSILIGFLFFMFMALRFNHRKMNQVKDKGVVFLCIVVSAIIGLVVALFVNVLCSVFYI
jgi:uncharacterized membrane protein YidH (DUF202 family)